MLKEKPLKRFTVYGTAFVTVDAEDEESVRALIEDIDLVLMCHEKTINVTPLRAWQIKEDKMN